MAGKNRSSQNTPNFALLKMAAGVFVSWLVIGVLLFGGSGKFNWGLGWLFFVLWGVLKLAFILLLRWHDPELMVERVTKHENSQRYERLILPVYFLASYGTILVAGLDAGRFQWSGEVPEALIVIAYLFYLFGNGLASWAVVSNPFFSSESRLQSDRDQKVARKGPYRYVRHPAYLAAILMWPVTGLLMASWWAAIPGLLAAVMMFIRAFYEDRMLLAELTGYVIYAQQVPYRLFPGIW